MQNQTLLKAIDAFIAANTPQIVQDIKSLVAVPSIKCAAEAGAPFGPPVASALNKALEIAQRMGLATCRGGGYVGWAEVLGQKEAYIASICHVDVVPEGGGWDGPPFEMRQKEGWLIGRGVLDDKGPCVLSLYAAKFLMEMEEPLRYGFRALIGCDEESGMSDIPHYLKENKEPAFCFSPDAEFPLCNGEKGIYSGAFLSPVLNGAIVQFCGGLAENAVPNTAFALVKTAKKLPKTEKVNTVAEGQNLVRLVAKGVGGHAANPEKTQNAIAILVDYLLEHDVCTKEERDFLLFLQKLHKNTDGSGLGIACKDPQAVFSPLTCIGGTILFENGVLRQGINVRYPTATSKGQISQILEKAAAEHAAKFCLIYDIPPFYIDANSGAIKTLLDAYIDVTGHVSKPFTIGGGTYARGFKNAVSFGPKPQKQILPHFAGPEHGANEGAKLEDLLTALKVYILALCRLQNLQF